MTFFLTKGSLIWSTLSALRPWLKTMIYFFIFLKQCHHCMPFSSISISNVGKWESVAPNTVQFGLKGILNIALNSLQSDSFPTYMLLLLTAHNWQNWKRVFLTCPCHEICKDEAVGLKNCKYTWKIKIYMNMWNLGQFREILIFFVNNCLIEVQI